jgi:ribosomal protein S27AE
MAAEAPLVCPRCGPAHPAHSAYPASERFCPRCGMPLVYAEGEGGGEGAGGGPQPLGELWQRARRIKPQYSEGALVRVVGARNLTEADFIQNLLLEEGIPSMQRRARGFDVPDFLAAGPRDILVPASGVPAARDVLLESELLPTGDAALWGPTAWRVLAGLLLGVAVLAILVWLHP